MATVIVNLGTHSAVGTKIVAIDQQCIAIQRPNLQVWQRRDETPLEHHSAQVACPGRAATERNHLRIVALQADHESCVVVGQTVKPEAAIRSAVPFLLSNNRCAKKDFLKLQLSSGNGLQSVVVEHRSDHCPSQSPLSPRTVVRHQGNLHLDISPDVQRAVLGQVPGSGHVDLPAAIGKAIERVEAVLVADHHQIGATCTEMHSRTGKRLPSPDVQYNTVQLASGYACRLQFDRELVTAPRLHVHRSRNANISGR